MNPTYDSRELHWEFFDRLGAPVVGMPGPLMRTADEVESLYAERKFFRFGYFDLTDPAMQESYLGTMNNIYAGWWELVTKREFVRPDTHYLEWLERYLVPKRQSHAGASHQVGPAAG